MSRSRWYVPRKDTFGEQLMADFRERRDDWRSWAPMAVPNRRKRKGKLQRIEHFLATMKDADREYAKGPRGASQHHAQSWNGRPLDFAAIRKAFDAVFGDGPLTNSAGDSSCSLPKTDAPVPGRSC